MLDVIVSSRTVFGAKFVRVNSYAISLQPVYRGLVMRRQIFISFAKMLTAKKTGVGRERRRVGRLKN